MSEKEPVPLEPYAALRAEIDAGEPVEAVIEREGLTNEAWAAAQAFWLKRMADEAEDKRFETTNRYQIHYRTKKKLFEADRARAKRKAAQAEIVEPPVAALAAAERELAARPGTAVPSMPLSPPPVVAKPLAQPSYAAPQAAQAPDAARAPARVSNREPERVDGRGPGPSAPPMTAPLPPAFVQPALVQAAPDSAQPLTQPVGEPPPRRSHKTLTVDIHQAMGSATPFVQPGQAPPATHSTMPAPAPPAASAPPPVATITAPPYAGAVPTSPAPPMGPAAAPIAPTAPPPVVQGASPQAAARPPSSPQAAPPPVGLAGGPGPQRINPKLMGTMNTTLDAMREPAMPFAPAAAGAPARKETNDAPSPKTVGTPFDAGARPPAEMRVASLSETMSSLDDDDDEPRTKMIDGAMAAAVAGAAERPLPFGQTTPDPATRTLDAAAVAAIANALERPTPFGGPPPHQNHQQQGYTKPEGRSPAPTGGLPFAPAKVAPGHDRPSDPGQPPGGLGSSHASSGSHPAVTTGHAGSGTHPAVTGAQAAPAQAQTSGKIFTLNQFASLTAEIAEAPTQVAEIRRKYGVTEAQHHAESQRWTEDFATNSELRQRYFGVVARYRSYLKNKP